MKTTFISTSAISEASRLSLLKLQSKLALAQKEVTTGRHADVGTALGYKTGQTVSLRQEHARLQTIIETNAVAMTRLDASQAALTGIVGNAQLAIGQLIAARNSESGPEVAQTQAKLGLVAFIDALNTALGDSYIFSGINADVKPFADYYQTPTSPGRQAVADAFLTAFGVAQNDPAVENITAADMQAFLDGPFAALFDDPAWSTNWSGASSQNVKSRISTSELIETSANANDAAIRKLARVYTMVADLGTENLNQGAFQAIVDTAVQLAGEAIQGVALLQSQLGTAQNRISDANDRMALQIDIMTNHINLLETVDPFEASTRVSALLTQIETAYAMTARIQSLSLLNYLAPR